MCHRGGHLKISLLKFVPPGGILKIEITFGGCLRQKLHRGGAAQNLIFSKLLPLDSVRFSKQLYNPIYASRVPTHAPPHAPTTQINHTQGGPMASTCPILCHRGPSTGLTAKPPGVNLAHPHMMVMRMARVVRAVGSRPRVAHSSHLSPSTISCIASVQPLITCE